jgi:hypothetical protein
MATLVRVQAQLHCTPVAGKTENEIIKAVQDTLPTTALKTGGVTMATVTDIADVEVFETWTE